MTVAGGHARGSARAAPRAAAAWAAAAALLLGSTGCFRLGLDRGSASDSAPRPDADRDGGAGDAEVEDAGPSSLTVTSVAPISELADPTADDSDPSLTADLLELYFASEGRSGGMQYEDIWVSTRADPAAPWGAPRLVAELSTMSRDSCPVVSGDGSTLVFGSNRPGGVDAWDLWITTRPDRLSAWQEPRAIAELNTDGDELPSWIRDDRLELLAHCHRGGQTDIFVSRRPSEHEPWGAFEPLPQVNGPGFDSSGRLSASGRRLVFDSDRPGGLGASDIHLARRSRATGPFEAIEPLAALNTSGNDSDPWLSEEPCRIFFARSPPGAEGVFDGPMALMEARCLLE